MITLPFSVSRNLRSQLMGNGGKSSRFEKIKDARTMKNGSSGIASSGSIVLETLVETNKPSHDPFYCLNLLISPLPTLEAEKGVFDVFLLAETTMMGRPFGGATSGLIVLYRMVKKNQHLYEHLVSFSRP